MNNHVFLNALMVLFAAQIVRIYLASFPKDGVRHKICYHIAWILYLLLQYYITFSQSEYNPLLPLSANFLLMTLIQFFSGIGIKAALFQSCVLGASWMAVEALTRGFLLTAGTDGEHFFITGNLISKIAMYIIVQTYKRLRKQNSGIPLPFRYWIELALIPISSILTICSAYVLTLGKWKNLLFAFVSILMIIVNYVIFDIYEKMSVHALVERQNRTYEKEIALCIRQAEEREEAYRQTRILRHDLKGHLIALGALLKEKRIQEAELEIEKMLEKNSINRHSIAETGNIALDALINYKSDAALSEGIRVECCLDVPTELFVESTDLCVILENLLDNALEAVRRLPKEQDKWISLTIRLAKGVLHITTENPYTGQITIDEQGKIRSSKTGDHGIGLMSVERIATKYAGHVNIFYEKERFRTFTSLYSRDFLHEKS